MFGQLQPQTGFGGFGGGFGGQPQQAPNGLGQPQQNQLGAFGQLQPNAFAQPQQQQSGLGGTFGAQPNAFGATGAFTQQPTSSAFVKYQETIQDGNHYMAINFMPQFKGKSIIEIRYEDYKANNFTKPVAQQQPQQQFGMMGQQPQMGLGMGFGQQQQPQMGGGMFGLQQQQPASMFGQQPQMGMMGQQQPQMGGAFGFR
ncbi:hypothetical protein EIN_164910 [Entamoeba invadens IP1]|uniref:Uncharacterized protein n=1 Tax=Entamoeba invadens IP1 TaxID=370355 RepID=A0A0A1U7M1_ENTIV|nr:hypothetical protein EIN_164910 [Entamoeba invadens IP1]ELP89051.1 hypothetical protein EIN_164910 [Entamoeba invadens IP1]|eukprot:XP_004255822.1 hypothetical protein EIN_164910 [Entamoeba invadens IP1]